MAVMPRRFGAECNADQMIIAQNGLTLARTIRRDSEKEPSGESFGSTGLRRLFRFSLRVHSLFYSDVLFIALTQEQMDAIPTKVLSCELLASCSRRESR